MARQVKVHKDPDVLCHDPFRRDLQLLSGHDVVVDRLQRGDDVVHLLLEVPLRRREAPTLLAKVHDLLLGQRVPLDSCRCDGTSNQVHVG